MRILEEDEIRLRCGVADETPRRCLGMLLYLLGAAVL